MIADDQIEKMMAELRQRGEAAADTDAAYKALDDATKSVLAECISDLNSDVSMAKAEQMARIAPKYREHLDALAKARRAASRARVSFEVYRTFIEMKRSQLATQRAEMSLR